MVETATTAFQFRRYREEVALRFSLQQCTTKETKAKARTTDALTDHANIASRSRSSLESDNDSGDGTVIQNLSNVIVLIDACGKVLTEDKSRSTETNDQNDNSIPIESDNAKQREPICVVPEGTTLLLRNLRDCLVTM